MANLGHFDISATEHSLVSSNGGTLQVTELSKIENLK